MRRATVEFSVVGTGHMDVEAEDEADAYTAADEKLRENYDLPEWLHLSVRSVEWSDGSEVI